MIGRKIGMTAIALTALVLSGCGAQQQIKDAINSAPTMTLGNIPTTVPNPGDLIGAPLHDQLVKQGFQSNSGKTEYIKGPVVVEVQNGLPNRVRVTYPEGTVSCPPTVMVFTSYAQLGDSLLGLGHSEVLKKYSGVCKPV